LWVHLVGNSSNAGHATVGFAIYFAAIWLLVIRAFVKPEKFSAWRLAAIALFTPLIGLGMVLGWEGAVLGTSHSVFSFIFGVGLPEEFAKALPVFLLVFLVRQLHLTPRTYLYLGAVSGLAFGAVEAVHLSTLYANGLPWDSVSTLTEYVWRLVSDPVMHACWAGISCYFIGLASVHRNKQVPLMAFGLGAAALLHGLFDFEAASWLQVAVIAFSLFVFVGYALGAERIADNYRSVVDATPIDPEGTDTSWVNQGHQAAVTPVSNSHHLASKRDRQAYEERRLASSPSPDVRAGQGIGELVPAAADFVGASK
jgi:RsiW-degrading membrane proteinase PrsW (M82 family)